MPSRISTKKAGSLARDSVTATCTRLVNCVHVLLECLYHLVWDRKVARIYLVALEIGHDSVIFLQRSLQWKNTLRLGVGQKNLVWPPDLFFFFLTLVEIVYVATPSVAFVLPVTLQAGKQQKSLFFDLMGITRCTWHTPLPATEYFYRCADFLSLFCVCSDKFLLFLC